MCLATCELQQRNVTSHHCGRDGISAWLATCVSLLLVAGCAEKRGASGTTDKDRSKASSRPEKTPAGTRGAGGEREDPASAKDASLSPGVRRWISAETRKVEVDVGGRRCHLQVPAGLSRKGSFGHSVSFEAERGLPWDEPRILLLSGQGETSVKEAIRKAKLRDTDKVLLKEELPDGVVLVYRTASGHLSAQRSMRLKAPVPSPDSAQALLGGVDCAVGWKVKDIARSPADWAAAQTFALSLCRSLGCP